MTEEIIELPETVTYDNQPYGEVVLGNLFWHNYVETLGHDRPKVYRVLIGTVISGVTVNRLFGERSVSDATGEQRIVYGVKPHELEAGRIVRAYCG